MRMLQRTSKHHQSAHLAAAVALGVVVGLVPKASLLAVGLYAGLLLLPIHTWLALAVSLLVGSVASYLDPLSHALGVRLLQQPTLYPLWHFLDNTAVLPWLGLHNTVVLGNLAIGIAQAGPSYLIAYRLFDRMRWRAPARVQHPGQEPIVVAPLLAEPVIIPPPKFITLPQPTVSPIVTVTSASTLEEVYEPAHEAAAIINSWHMGQAAEKSRQRSVVSGVSGPAAHASAGQAPAGSDASQRSNYSRDECGPMRSFDMPPPRQPAGRSEIVDSLDLAQSASEVLAWVDGMLEECLSEDRTRSVAHDPHSSQMPPVAAATATPGEPSSSAGAGEEHWLMETTIEVVRWGEGAQPALQPTAAPAGSPGSPSDDAESARPQALKAYTAQDPFEDSAAQATAPRRLPGPESEEAQDRSSHAEGSCPSIVQFVPYRQRGAASNGTAQPQGQPQGQTQDGGDSDAQRSECLGYLLGHLRQEREGRSS